MVRTVNGARYANSPLSGQFQIRNFQFQKLEKADGGGVKPRPPKPHRFIIKTVLIQLKLKARSLKLKGVNGESLKRCKLRQLETEKDRSTEFFATKFMDTSAE